MVKVLRSRVSGPLEPYATGFAEELLRQGYSRSGAEQHMCFIAHPGRWLSAAGVGLGELSGPVTEAYLTERRAAGECAVTVGEGAAAAAGTPRTAGRAAGRAAGPA